MKDAKISNVEVYLVERAVKGNFADSTRNVETIGYAVTVVTLDNGLYGVGLTYHEVGGEAIREFVLRALKPKLLGRSPFETEAIWEECFHYIRGVGRKGLAFCAYSSVDIALWDLKGQLLDMPLYKLLGGTKKKIPIYASGGWTSYSCEELVEEAREMVRRGYTMIKLKVGVEGGRNPNEDVRRIQAVRDAIGPDIGLMLDANNVWRASTAVQVANRLRGCVRESDAVFRIGGDEFALIVNGAVTEGVCKSRVEKIKAAIREPYRLKDAEVQVGTSCGCAVYPCDSDDVRAIRILADHRMYEDKQRSGRS